MLPFNVSLDNGNTAVIQKLFCLTAFSGWLVSSFSKECSRNTA